MSETGSCEDSAMDDRTIGKAARDTLVPCECGAREGAHDSRSPRLLPPIFSDSAGSQSKMQDEDKMTTYLNHHKEFLQSYVLENIPVSELQKWLVMKMSREPVLSEEKHNHQRTNRNHPKYEIKDLIEKLGENTCELAISWEIAKNISSSIGYDAYRVFKIFPDHPNYVQYFVTETKEDLELPPRMERANPDDVTLVLEVAEAASTMRLRRDNSSCFPDLPHSLLKIFGKDDSARVSYIMYHPILTVNGKTAYVIEMWRVNEEFSDDNEETSCNLTIWSSLVLHYCKLYLDKTKERSMTDFLLDVVKAIFEEMVSLDQLIKRILEFAQKLVNADRSSLFLVDYRNFELVSTVFDLKFEPGHGRDMEKKEIRMPINRGIAGHVALSGETMNIPDAYSDYRFNREVDEATGYKTISILCMPVKVQGKVIGVVQMVNKRNNDNFDHEDEVAFEIFSTFFGLALHHARLYDKIMRKEQKYRVALEVLSYHNTCREHEVEEILKDNKYIGHINDFYLDPYKLDDFQKCKAVITMFDDLFDLSRFNVLLLTRFVLTVRKNYRVVPYHNFDHGWSVAQAMYAIIKHDTKKRFDYKMRLALFVACLCHDLDHRGYTNKYLNEIASPLAAMYTTSPLEHHHFNITVTILQQDGHNIFSHLSSEDYKDILSYIRHCILATDLAAFFPNLVKLKDMFKNDNRRNKFNWLNPNHRDLAMAISMTSADLSAAAKPWDIQIKTVKVIFEEFYDQGDKERAVGKTPIPMMDRSKPEEQPASQVGFLSQICIPCYKMLCKIIPKTKPMYEMVLKNLNIWKSKAILPLENEEMESVSDNISDVATESDEEDSAGESSPKYKTDVANNNERAFTQVNVCDKDDEALSKITSEMESNWKCIKSDSVSWEDDQGFDYNTVRKTNNVWRDIGNTWVDDEGVVLRSNKALKIMSADAETSDTSKI
ncbi:probable 3',5'-cyclic phosphodiesterase pde-5 isoform X2 [Aricia agestis]|uniref:probable 3',5'-cyclic phosphodiesterase pde-5 isoform X2 n=1 Tax=Aricia agestis TaxID=91739 RepID=UPI001C201E41|nr:probable 3',5'-cyclic phosphodiesterase pde-5 isoform X2 [Aricia agestis]